LSNNNAPLLWLLLLLLEVKHEIKSQVRRKSIGDEKYEYEKPSL